MDVAKVNARPLVQQRAEFRLRIGHRPAVEISRLLVERWEHLPEKVPIRSVAVSFGRRAHPRLNRGFRTDDRMLHCRVGHGREVWNGNVFPRTSEYLTPPAAGLDRKSTRLNSSHLGISY